MKNLLPRARPGKSTHEIQLWVILGNLVRRAHPGTRMHDNKYIRIDSKSGAEGIRRKEDKE